MKEPDEVFVLLRPVELLVHCGQLVRVDAFDAQKGPAAAGPGGQFNQFRPLERLGVKKSKPAQLALGQGLEQLCRRIGVDDEVVIGNREKLSPIGINFAQQMRRVTVPHLAAGKNRHGTEVTLVRTPTGGLNAHDGHLQGGDGLEVAFQFEQVPARHRQLIQVLRMPP